VQLKREKLYGLRDFDVCLRNIANEFRDNVRSLDEYGIGFTVLLVIGAIQPLRTLSKKVRGDKEGKSQLREA
jgi:hypothetical protein